MSTDAVLQLEFDRKRWGGYGNDIGFVDCGPQNTLECLLKGLTSDTLKNGGTLVIVASEDTVTIVQRAAAADLTERAQGPKRAMTMETT